MIRRAARITQTEIERAIRAARKLGLPEIEMKIGDGTTIRIPLSLPSTNNSVADSAELVL